MKNLILVSFLFIFCYSCTAPAGDNGAENIAIIERYITAVEAGDYATIESLIAEDYIGHGPSIDDTSNREEGLASWKYNLENLYESIQYDRKRFIAKTITDGDYPGDWVSSWGVVTIKYKDGRGPVRLYANTLYRVENGKISNSFTIYNEYDVLEQLGMN